MKTSKLLKTLSGLTMLAVVGKMLAFLRESFISSRYGAGFITDIYFFEDGLVNVINSVFASAISSTFIPIYLSIKNDEERKKYTNIIISVMGLICVVAIIICIFFTDELLHLLVPGFYGKYDMTYVVQITRIFIPTVLMIFLENVLIILFHANGHYFYSSLQSLILNISLIFYLLFAHKFGIMGIIITKIITHLIILVILLVSLKKKSLFKYNFIPNFGDEKLKKTIKLSLPVVAVSLLSQFNYLIDKTMSSLLPIGSMSLISYATTVSMLIYYVIGNSFTNIFYTVVSKAQDNKEEMTKEFIRFTKYLMRILIPICIVVCFFSYNIVNILYGRGEMIDSNLKIISFLIILYLPGNFFLCIRDFLNRICYATNYTYITSISASCGFILNIILNIILLRFIGIYGLALATTISSIIATIILVIMIKNKKIFSKFNLSKDMFIIIRTIVTVIFNFVLFILFGKNSNLITNIFLIGLCCIFSVVLLNIDIIKEYLKRNSKGEKL